MSYYTEEFETLATILKTIASADPMNEERLAFMIRKEIPDVATTISKLFEEDRASAPKVEGPPPRAAPVKRLKAAQVSLWDNHKGRSKKSGIRWGMTIELWDDTCRELKLNNYTFKSQCALMNAKLFKDHIRKNMKGKERVYSCSDQYVRNLEELASNMAPDQYVALLNSNIKDGGSAYRRGRCYHDNQLVMIDGNPNKGIEKAMLFIDGETLDLNHFSNQPYGKKPFNPKVVLQARIDLCDFFPPWATNSLVDDE